jgi:hypothetical protein
VGVVSSLIGTPFLHALTGGAKVTTTAGSPHMAVEADHALEYCDKLKSGRPSLCRIGRSSEWSCVARAWMLATNPDVTSALT